MEALRIVIATLAAIGIGTAVYALFLSLAETGTKVARWWKGRRNPLYRFFGEAKGRMESLNPWRQKKPGMRPFLFPAGALVLALVARDPVFSPYVLFLGIAAGWYWGWRDTGKRAEAASLDDVESLVYGLRSRYQVNASPVSNLAQAVEEMPAGELRRWLKEVLNVFAGEDFAAGFDALQKAPSRYIRRLAVILKAASRASTSVVREALVELEADIREHKRLKGMARSELILLKLTVRFLMAANIAAMTVALALPAWRSYFAAAPMRRLVFIALTLGVATGYAYFDQEIRFLEERTL